MATMTEALPGDFDYQAGPVETDEMAGEDDWQVEGEDDWQVEGEGEPVHREQLGGNMEAMPGDFDYQSGPVDAQLADAPTARDLEFEREQQREQQQQKELNAELEGDMIVLCHGLGNFKQDDDYAEPVFVRTRETLTYVKDIRRLLNFDSKTNAASREIFLKLGGWNLMQRKIIPLLKNYSDERLLSFELLKVMVLLTDAPSDLAEPVQKEKHLKILYRYKDAFLQDDVLAMLMQLVADPLSREGRERTDDDIKFIELVLHLFKNLLVVPDAHLREGSGGDNLTHMHDDLIAAFDAENVLEMLLIMTQDIRDERYQHWGVLVLEMLACIFRNKTADSILRAAIVPPKNVLQPSPNAEAGAVRGSAKGAAEPKFDPNDPLYNMLCQDKQKHKNSIKLASSRHNRFYGSFRIQAAKNKPYRGFRRGFKEEMAVVAPPARGRKKPLLTNQDPKMSHKVATILVKFVDDFLEYSYSQMLQVVVRKIVHMSPEIRIEDITNFCTVNALILSIHSANPNLNEQKIGLVAHAIEQHNFRFLMRQFDENCDPKIKQWHLLPPILSCLRAMLATVRLVGKDAGSSAKAAARRLELNLLYDQQLCMMVTSQLRDYRSERHDRHYVGNLIEVANFLVKMTEEFMKSQQTVLIRSKRQKKKKKKKKMDALAGQEGQEGKEEEEEEEPEEDDVEMDDHDHEKELNTAQLIQHFCHPKILQQYVLVLGHCMTNPPRLNRCVVRMLTMVCKHDGGQVLPMLYHVPTLRTLKHVMASVPAEMLKSRSDLRESLDFSTAIVRNFLRTLKAHAVLGLDALFTKQKQTASLIAYNYDVPIKEKKGNKAQAHQDVEVAVASEPEWQEHEDQLLRDQYPGLAEKQGVCNILAHQLGGDRNAQMVSRRLAVLGLRKQGAALRATTFKGPDFLRKTVGILRQQAHETLSNTIRRATHPGLRAKMLVGAMQWVRSSITQAFELREELSLEAVQYNKRAEPAEDFCLVPVTEEHWKWLSCHWMPAVLNSLCIRPASPGESWWRIPKEVADAKVEMCMNVLEAFLDEPPEHPEEELAEGQQPDDEDRPENEMSGAEEDEAADESSEESDEEWTAVRAKTTRGRRRGVSDKEMASLPDSFEEPEGAPPTNETDEEDDAAAKAPSEEPKKKTKKKTKKKRKDVPTPEELNKVEQNKNKRQKMKKKLSKLAKAAVAEPEEEQQPEEQPEEQPAAVPEEPEQVQPKRRKLQRKSQVQSDSDAEQQDSDAEQPAADAEVVPDSYVPAASNRQKRRKAMLSDSDDE